MSFGDFDPDLAEDADAWCALRMASSSSGEPFSFPPIIEIKNPSYFTFYYGFAIRFSGSSELFYFTHTFERPEFTISCAAESIDPSRKGYPPSPNIVRITTRIERSSTAPSVNPTQLKEELQANTSFLGKYSSISKADLAPELAQKLIGSEKRNKEIEALLRQNASLSQTFRHEFQGEAFAAASEMTLFFDGFVVILSLQRNFKKYW